MLDDYKKLHCSFDDFVYQTDFHYLFTFPVRRSSGSFRRVRLHGQGLEPRDGGMPPHTIGSHQQGLLATGKIKLTAVRTAE